MLKSLFFTWSKKSSMLLSAMLTFVIVFFSLALNFPSVAQAATTLNVYPAAPAGVTLNTDYTVKVRVPGGAWKDLDEYETRIGGATAGNASFVSFDTDGSVELSVTYNAGSITSAAIRPLNNNITPTISGGNTLTFSINGPKKLSVEVNGDINHNLMVFANPVEVNPPSASDPDVIYLGPGLYTQDYTVPSGKTLYIAGGAVVKGGIIMDNATNAKVLGRGILDHPSGRAVSADYANQITIEGIIVNDYGHANNGGCAVSLGNSTNVTIDNFKAFSYKRWTDGIDTFAATNVTVNNSFLRTGDDGIAIYAARQNGGKVWGGDSSNITVTNSTFMPDIARPINIGTHGDDTAPGGGYTINNINFSNLDILLHNPLSAGKVSPIQIANGDGNLITNVKFTDIRIEDNSTGRIANIATQKTDISAGRGVSNVYFKNVTFTGPNTGTSNINGYSASQRTENVTFENLVVNGNVITSPAAASFSINSFTNNINFVASGASSPTPAPYPFPEPINLALNRTASADSTQSGNSSANGNDDSTTTRWTANNGNLGHWWKVDLGSSVNITGGTQVMWELAGAYNYKIETSNDNVYWTLKVDKTANTNTSQVQNDLFYDTARYVRITVTGLPSGAWASLYDFKVFGEPTNLALGKTASADVAEAANPAAKGSDGNEMTRWTASDGSSGHWWKVDLGANRNISYGTQVMWEKSGAYKYKIETSTDNTNWTLKVDKTTNTFASQVQTDYFSTSARYIRITVTGLPSSAWASFYDFKVFGDPVNLALSQTATAESSQSLNPASAGNDNNTVTRWSANDASSGHWWTVDLGSNKNITGGTQVMWETPGVYYGYMIETSTDNVNWTLRIDKTGNIKNAQVQSDYFVATARYVRITVTSLPSGTYASFYDFKVIE